MQFSDDQGLSSDYIQGLGNRPLTRVCPQMMTQHLSKGTYLSFPQVIYQVFSLGHQPPLSTGNLPLLVHRPYMYACPHVTYQGLLTDHLPCLVHKPPIRASLQTMYQGLSIGYKLELVHRWWSNTCPEATNQSFLKEATYHWACLKVTCVVLSSDFIPRLLHSPYSPAYPQTIC